MLPVEIWMLNLSYLPLIDLFNVSICSKAFYSMARENVQLKMKLKYPHSLIKCSDLFERYWGLVLSVGHEFSKKFMNYFDEDNFLLVKKKLLDDILFETLPFRIFHHLFYCNRGFYVHDKCVFCTIFHVREGYLSDYLNNSFTYPLGYIFDCKHDFYFGKVSLFVHYYDIIYSSRD